MAYYIRIEDYCRISMRANMCIIMRLHLHSLAVCSPRVLLTPWSRDRFKKLIVARRVNKVTVFWNPPMYWRFLSALLADRHLS
jgi:hypothetical protein